MPNKHTSKRVRQNQNLSGSQKPQSHIGTDLAEHIGRMNNPHWISEDEQRRQKAANNAASKIKALEQHLDNASKAYIAIEKQLQQQDTKVLGLLHDKEVLQRQLSDLQAEFIGKQMEVGEVRYDEKVHWAKVAARAMLRINQYVGDLQPISTAKAILGEAFLDAFPEIGNTGDEALIRFLGEKFEEPEPEPEPEPEVKTNYRIRFRYESAMSGTFYVWRMDGRVRITSTSGTPHSLSNFVIGDAEAFRFALEDCKDGEAACRVLHSFIGMQVLRNVENLKN